MSEPKELEFTENLSSGGGGDVDGKIGGEIFIPVDSEQIDHGTLDEPVTTTLNRDLKAILKKCLHVLFPVHSNKSLLHDWDLWGPLLLCISMALLLHGHSRKAHSDDHTIHFVHVFLLVWGGAAVVTINAQLLRGKVSFFQSVCTLGYCLLPLALSLLLSRIILTIFVSRPMLSLVLRAGFIVAAVIWSTKASLGFLSKYLPQDRKILAVYPIALFYIALGFLILAQTHPLI